MNRHNNNTAPSYIARHIRRRRRQRNGEKLSISLVTVAVLLISGVVRVTTTGEWCAERSIVRIKI